MLNKKVIKIAIHTYKGIWPERADILIYNEKAHVFAPAHGSAWADRLCNKDEFYQVMWENAPNWATELRKKDGYLYWANNSNKGAGARFTPADVILYAGTLHDSFYENSEIISKRPILPDEIKLVRADEFIDYLTLSHILGDSIFSRPKVPKNIAVKSTQPLKNEVDKIKSQQKPGPKHWFDFENKIAVDFPPESVKCFMKNNNGYYVSVIIIASVDGYVIGWSKDKLTSFASNKLQDFKPLDNEIYAYEKSNRIEKVKKVLLKEGIPYCSQLDSILSVLSEKKMLLLPK